MSKRTCPTCDGDGTLKNGSTCQTCGGSGEVEQATKQERSALGRKNQGTKNPRKPGKK